MFFLDINRHFDENLSHLPNLAENDSWGDTRSANQRNIAEKLIEWPTEKTKNAILQ